MLARRGAASITSSAGANSSIDDGRLRHDLARRCRAARDRRAGAPADVGLADEAHDASPPVRPPGRRRCAPRPAWRRSPPSGVSGRPSTTRSVIMLRACPFTPERVPPALAGRQRPRSTAVSTVARGPAPGAVGPSAVTGDPTARGCATRSDRTARFPLRSASRTTAGRVSDPPTPRAWDTWPCPGEPRRNAG